MNFIVSKKNEWVRREKNDVKMKLLFISENIEKKKNHCLLLHVFFSDSLFLRTDKLTHSRTKTNLKINQRKMSDFNNLHKTNNCANAWRETIYFRRRSETEREWKNEPTTNQREEKSSKTWWKAKNFMIYSVLNVDLCTICVTAWRKRWKRHKCRHQNWTTKSAFVLCPSVNVFVCSKYATKREPIACSGSDF